MKTVLGLALAAAVLAVAACSGGGAAASVSAPPDSDVTIDAKNNVFDKAQVTAPAGEAFGLFFRNLDGVPHNVAIFTDSSAGTSLFVGETVTDKAILYAVPALEAGEYYFRCDVHPEMKGTIVAGG